MSKSKGHIPNRKCVGCKTVRPKEELDRYVLERENPKVYVLDEEGGASGRGVYLCKTNEACAKKAAKRLKAEFVKNSEKSSED